VAADAGMSAALAEMNKLAKIARFVMAYLYCKPLTVGAGQTNSRESCAAT